MSTAPAVLSSQAFLSGIVVENQVAPPLAGCNGMQQATRWPATSFVSNYRIEVFSCQGLQEVHTPAPTLICTCRWLSCGLLIGSPQEQPWPWPAFLSGVAGGFNPQFFPTLESVQALFGRPFTAASFLLHVLAINLIAARSAFINGKHSAGQTLVMEAVSSGYKPAVFHIVRSAPYGGLV